MPLCQPRGDKETKSNQNNMVPQGDLLPICSGYLKGEVNQENMIRRESPTKRKWVEFPHVALRPDLLPNYLGCRKRRKLR